MNLINHFFLYTGFILVFINTLLYLIGYKQNKKAVAYKYFTLYLLISCIILFTSYIVARIYKNNLYVSHIYFIGQFLLLSLFYHSLFKKTQKKYIIFFIIIVCLMLGIQYILRPDLFFRFNLFEIFITSLPLIIYAIMHLYNSLSQNNDYLIINAGVLIYISSSTLIFILGNYLSDLDMTEAVRNIYLINRILYVVYLTLILIQWQTSFRRIKNR